MWAKARAINPNLGLPNKVFETKELILDEYGMYELCGAYIALHSSIDPAQMDMYADVEARADVFEPEGIVDVKMHHDKIHSWWNVSTDGPALLPIAYC